MYLRLAFAVAAHLEPDILIVDEVLAVGDAAFQKKCLGKMGSVAHAGRTVLFVSHNMPAVEALCHDAIWLDSGTLIERGTAEQIVSHYLTRSTVRNTERVWPEIASAPGNDAVRLQRATIYPEDGSPSEPVTVRTPFVIEFEYWQLQADTELSLSLVLYNEQGIAVFNTFPVNQPERCVSPSSIQLFQSRCHIPGNLLNNGMHRVQLLVVKNRAYVIYTADDVLVFDVFDDFEMRGEWYGDWIGAVRPKITWTTQLITTDPPAQRHRYETGAAPLTLRENR
jgi:lipopolysaccharide transport system ATP-binding protein